MLAINIMCSGISRVSDSIKFAASQSHSGKGCPRAWNFMTAGFGNQHSAAINGKLRKPCRRPYMCAIIFLAARLTHCIAGVLSTAHDAKL